MPVLNEPLGPSGPGLIVRPSAVIELEWVLASANRDDYLDDHPTLRAAYESNAGLQQEVASVWTQGPSLSCDCFIELMVVANQGRELFTLDPDTVFEQFDDLVANAPGDPATLPLHSESASDRQAVYERLARLRQSASLRRRYVEVARAVWAAVLPDWERWGRGAAETETSWRRDLMNRGADWRQVARLDCGRQDFLDATVANVGADATVAVVPAFFTHKGLIVDLPGMVVSGVRTDTSAAAARARTEAVARQLKTISDPTRLAILDALRHEDRTVTELASAFGLAQPTVSNHVKVLRDAGLVRDERDGTRRRLVVCHQEVDDMLSNLRGVLGDSTAMAESRGVTGPAGADAPTVHLH
jgi:DNA-binding transcriptional ArsR family regulator